MKSLNIGAVVVGLVACGAVQAKKINVRNCTQWNVHIAGDVLEPAKGKCAPAKTINVSKDHYSTKNTLSISVHHNNKKQREIAAFVLPIKGVQTVRIDQGGYGVKGKPENHTDHFPIVRINDEQSDLNN